MKITIFTPTYNRASLLPELYRSLLQQSRTDFLWLIIDDGSTDETAALVNSWQQEGVLEIDYRIVENGGKARAHNAAVDACSTELFICVDSDDTLVPSALAKFAEAWDSVADDPTCSGIVSLRGTTATSPIGTSMPSGVTRSSLSDLYRRHSFKGDTALLWRTDLLRRFPFEVAEGEKFMGEGYVYMQIDRDHSLVVLDEILYVGAYQPDGYTMNIRRIIEDSPNSYARLNWLASNHAASFRERYVRTARYLVGCALAGKPISVAINAAPNRSVALAALPLSRIVLLVHYGRIR